jgi:uncharacterized protein with GYD domain
MLTYVGLYKWTEQGIKDVKNTTKRAKEAQSAIESMGGRLTTVLWTQGEYDVIVIAEFPDEDTAMAFTVSLSKLGNIKTKTLRAFSATDVERILSKVP